MSTTPPTETDDDLIWHYTNAEGLYGIINDQAIHCTNCLFLNDSKEYMFAMELVKGSLQNYFKSSKSGRLYTLNRICHALEEAHINNKDNLAPYLSCFSKNKDLLSQWRGYCPSGGYSIGFVKFKNMKDSHFKICDVSYVDKKNCFNLSKKKELKEFINSFEENIIDSQLDIGLIEKSLNLFSKKTMPSPQQNKEYELYKKLHKLVLSYIPQYKDISFKEEQEIRISTFHGDGVKFKRSQNLLTPFVSFPFVRNQIKKIIIGPNPLEEKIELGLRIFLRSKRLEHIQIDHSKTPYRTHH
jgi:hypothetical protein